MKLNRILSSMALLALGLSSAAFGQGNIKSAVDVAANVNHEYPNSTVLAVYLENRPNQPAYFFDVLSQGQREFLLINAETGDIHPGQVEEPVALTSGRLSLEESITIARREVGGTVIEAAFSQESIEPIYEVVVIKDGKTWLLTINTQTGKILRKEFQDDSPDRVLATANIDLIAELKKAEGRVNGSILGVYLEREENLLIAFEYVTGSDWHSLTIDPKTGETDYSSEEEEATLMAHLAQLKQPVLGLDKLLGGVTSRLGAEFVDASLQLEEQQLVYFISFANDERLEVVMVDALNAKVLDREELDIDERNWP